MEQHLDCGLYHGVTTNPVLLERAGVRCTIPVVSNLARDTLAGGLVDEFMVQAWGESCSNLVECGRTLASVDDRLVVKVPLTREGVRAAAHLTKDGARICMTACYNKEQAFLAAGLGAEYVAPYLGRISDQGKDGLAEVAAMVKVIEGLGSTTRVLVASLRSPQQLTALAERGCDTFTFAPKIASGLFDEPLTTDAAADFERAAKAMSGGPES
eukprot:FR742026.1.p1 GENE.FR742026.1~~FR742026.1.p1  ORF type:complete len:241 (+),score=15.83 FR742026.1:85-723(+)